MLSYLCRWTKLSFAFLLLCEWVCACVLVHLHAKNIRNSNAGIAMDSKEAEHSNLALVTSVEL